MSLDEKFLPVSPRMVDYVANSEPWAQYTLEDGTIVRVRIMLVSAIDEGFYGPDHGDMEGYPKVKLEMNQVLNVTFPEHVKDAAAKRRGEAT